MILIADCGSTKTHWCLLDQNTVKKEYFTIGMNAVLLTAGEMEDIIRRELLPEMGELAAAVKEVYFYGDVWAMKYAAMLHRQSKPYLQPPTPSKPIPTCWEPLAHYAAASQVLPAFSAPAPTHVTTMAKKL